MILGIFLIIIGICILILWQNKNKIILWLQEQNINIKKKINKNTINEYIIKNINDKINKSWKPSWKPDIQIIPFIVSLISLFIVVMVGFIVLDQVKEALPSSQYNATEIGGGGINVASSFLLFIPPLIIIIGCVSLIFVVVKIMRN